MDQIINVIIANSFRGIRIISYFKFEANDECDMYEAKQKPFKIFIIPF